jgi:hypothetical protein
VRFGRTPDEAKAGIRSELLRRQALTDANRQASEFASELFNMEPETVTNLLTLAKTNLLPVRVTKPFDEERGPAEFDGGPNFAKTSFLLSAEKPFPEQPIVGESAVYVIAFDNRFPDEILPLDQIRDRVTADYRYRQAVQIARRAGEDFSRAAASGLAQGKAFAAVCSDGGVRHVVVPVFSISTSELPELENHVDPSQFKQIATITPPRTVSGLSPAQDGGFVVYVKERLPVDQARIKAEMPAFLNLLRRARQQEALNLWLTKEGSVSLRNTPLAQRQQSPPGARQGQTRRP